MSRERTRRAVTEEATMEGYVLEIEIRFIADPREDSPVPGRKRAVSKPGETRPLVRLIQLGEA